MNKRIPGRHGLMTGVFAAMLSVGAVSTAQAADDVLALQNALYGAGYDIDNANGKMGASTQAALLAFQKDHANLKASGSLDTPTKEALGLIVASSAPAKSAPAKAAPAKAATKPAASAQAKASPKPAEPEEDDVIEEDDDGGWSFF
ncbi:peptidoglycan-binding domain-containing protein [Marinobacter sp. BGYM27]|uniref:peptidoglycan-binding domain-containing protein n=1 Tax=Marinobacter sp. BGYM27 TaxID=2975597 RepID=UPI0021A6100A|nr:peptidoglycan-binding domain-containing protein [Marinobacter sp. BGYM27]MDG5498141.1 peptidoglycan-binding domain-containing protein [Marinobacter sp. BGYM27]